VDLLAANPYVTIKKAAHQLRVAFTTAQRGIEKLAKMGILAQVGTARRDRVYCAKAILGILEEPARIVPER
jgi:Fic family protein